MFKADDVAAKAREDACAIAAGANGQQPHPVSVDHSPKRKRPRPETVAKRALKAGLPVKSYTTADGTTINLGEPDSSAAVTSNPWDAATEALTKQ
jgi:hypothetical protein